MPVTNPLSAKEPETKDRIADLEAQVDEWQKKFALLKKLGQGAEKRFKSAIRMAERRIDRLKMSKRVAEDERDAMESERDALKVEMEALREEQKVAQWLQSPLTTNPTPETDSVVVRQDRENTP